MNQTIFFDLDGTLWKADHPLLQTAWERLPYACKTILGELPQDFRWQDHAGSTDLGVVSSMVDQLKSGLDISRRHSIIQRILGEMDRYYIEHAPSDISPALFPDTVRGLNRLTDLGHTLGIITGNTRRVTDAKLEAAGLASYFSTEPNFRLTGDQSRSRAELLQKAWINTLMIRLRESGVSPLIYVADTYRDLTETFEAYNELVSESAKLEVRLLLRMQPSLVPDQERIWVNQHRFRTFQIYPFAGIADEQFLQAVEGTGLYEEGTTSHPEKYRYM